ncbi:hypothetical protein HHL17_07000 [Chitinophaga sp. G-6-1-13]|uniref:Class I lanthipeptide n=1 Tax=Chitinophaga fulva TaxID=2728842 RepID=A0A848GIQ2_9BACT|nr:class I lanthipeptide [Chitinophaga fulva]NML36942.1 hypothetical protein [Chitinophaga fulva]
MKKKIAPKKLQLAKVKIAELTINQAKQKEFICQTSFAETTCRGCVETILCV